MSNELIELTDRSDLWALGIHLVELQKKVKVYSQQQALNAAKTLALKMQAVIPADVLYQMHVVPIPRGGLFVTAELSYLLNWHREQFVDDGRSPVCIVDDCSLTGKRFGETLRRFEGRDIWFCHLASTVELREAILLKEGKVKGCIAAEDLCLADDSKDPSLPNDPDRYLNRSISHVAYPWTEPGLPVVLPFSGDVQDGWHLIPPHMAKGNLAALNIPLVDGDYQPDIELPAGVVWRLIEDRVILFEAEGQTAIELRGDTAAVWKCCAGSRSTIWAEKNISKSIGPIIETLLAKRLLVRI